jgi:uncharacterized protein
MNPPPVVARRREERAALLETARGFVSSLAGSLDIQAAVVFGSVARGDFNAWSDVDVLLVVPDLPDTVPARYSLLGRLPPKIEAVLWTPAEWSRESRRRNPIAEEARHHGEWIVATAQDLDGVSQV